MNTVTLAEQYAERQAYKDMPYFNEKIESLLTSKGAKIHQIDGMTTGYRFTINREELMIEINWLSGRCEIRYWFDFPGDDDRSPERKWLTHDDFTMPVGGPFTEKKFLQILNAYITWDTL